MKGNPGIPKKRKYYCDSCKVKPKLVADCYDCWKLRRRTSNRNPERTRVLQNIAYYRDRKRHHRAVEKWAKENPEKVRAYRYRQRHGPELADLYMLLADLKKRIKKHESNHNE